MQIFVIAIPLKGSLALDPQSVQRSKIRTSPPVCASGQGALQTLGNITLRACSFFETDGHGARFQHPALALAVHHLEWPPDCRVQVFRPAATIRLSYICICRLSSVGRAPAASTGRHRRRCASCAGFIPDTSWQRPETCDPRTRTGATPENSTAAPRALRRLPQQQVSGARR